MLKVITALGLYMPNLENKPETKILSSYFCLILQWNQAKPNQSLFSKVCTSYCKRPQQRLNFLSAKAVYKDIASF